MKQNPRTRPVRGRFPRSGGGRQECSPGDLAEREGGANRAITRANGRTMNVLVVDVEFVARLCNRSVSKDRPRISDRYRLVPPVLSKLSDS